MTIEELYTLRSNLLKNKEAFSRLNKGYWELLNKRYEKEQGKALMSDEELIKKMAEKMYNGRFLLMFPLVFFNVSTDILLLLSFANVGLLYWDKNVFLPYYLRRKRQKPIKKTKEDIEQDQLYEEVCRARELYHALNRQYEEEFNKMSLEETRLYQEYLNSIGEVFQLDVEERRDSILSSIEDNKMLNKKYGDELTDK